MHFRNRIQAVDTLEGAGQKAVCRGAGETEDSTSGGGRRHGNVTPQDLMSSMEAQEGRGVEEDPQISGLDHWVVSLDETAK